MYDVSCVWMLSGLADGCGSRPLLFIFEDKNLNYFKAGGAVDWLPRPAVMQCDFRSYLFLFLPFYSNSVLVLIRRSRFYSYSILVP